MERGKKETPASDRSSTRASYPVPCVYFKAELHPVMGGGGHQTRDLSHVKSTGCLPQQRLGDERGLVHHCWKFQLVPTRRKKRVCLRKPGVNTAMSPVRSLWLWANYPVPLNSCKKKHLERAFSLGTMPLPVPITSEGPKLKGLVSKVENVI